MQHSTLISFTFNSNENKSTYSSNNRIGRIYAILVITFIGLTYSSHNYTSIKTSWLCIFGNRYIYCNPSFICMRNRDCCGSDTNIILERIWSSIITKKDNGLTWITRSSKVFFRNRKCLFCT
jgi:hypothetical protein